MTEWFEDETFWKATFQFMSPAETEADFSWR